MKKKYQEGSVPVITHITKLPKSFGNNSNLNVQTANLTVIFMPYSGFYRIVSF